MNRKTIALALIALTLMGVLAACTTVPGGVATTAATQGASTTAATQAGDTTAAATQAADPNAPAMGGELKVTINSDPVSLDALLEGGESEQIPATHIFETALSADAGGNIFPGVCDYEFDGTVLRLTVRDGVTFHDGSAVTIQDVEASMVRWLANVKFGTTHFGSKLASSAVEGNALVCTFAESAPLALTAVARYSQGLYITPKAICEKYPDGKIMKEDYIGTGPYKFVEHLADRYVLVERYEGYVPTTADADGLAAPKMAYLDKIYFYPVSDKTTRITGVQTGEYDVGIGVPSNLVASMSAEPGLVVEIKDLGITAVMIFNSNQGIGTDVNLRHAILHCLDMDEMMLAAQGDPSLYYLNPSVLHVASRWYTDIGSDEYNNLDLEKAQAYLDASSYDGETLRFITTKDNDYFYKTAMVVAEKVKAIGIQIDVQVYDNATLRQYRDDPTKFDIFSGGLGPYDDPVLLSLLDSAWAGNWENAKKDDLMAQMAAETDFSARYAIWEQVSAVLYEDLPVVTFGERRNPIVYKAGIHNMFETSQKIYWNCWVEQ